MEENNTLPNGVLHTKVVKAGKRTYFVDIRQTQQEDYYVSLTESTKKRNGDKNYYVRNKVLIYKEDFNKVLEALQDTISKVKEDLMPEYDFEKFDNKDMELDNHEQQDLDKN